MGLFDIFKNKEQSANTYVQPQENRLPYTIRKCINENGKLQIDFEDNNADFKQFYDTTRLILDGQALCVNDNIIQKALVSWYGSDECVMFGENGEEIGRRTEYEEVYLGIDQNLIQTDNNYCYAVMKNLLNKKRIEQYLQRGMQEQPENPCGNYVGEIVKNERGYVKIFKTEVGRAVHNSGFMQQKRKENQIRIEEARQKLIYDKNEQIARLQKEIEDISK